MPSFTNRKSIKRENDQWIFHGYRFDDDDVANQMAYLFHGKMGQDRAKEIREAAEKIQEPEGRKQYIEQEIKKIATEVDEKFQKGLTEIIPKLSTSGKENISGEAAGKNFAVSLMQGLGLNVDPDNVQTHYSSGPPQCFQITWVNRPTTELKDEKSEINQLSKCYAESLGHTPEAQRDFNKKWDAHINNAKAGGPKIVTTKFNLESSKSFEKAKTELGNGDVERQPTSPKLS